MGKPKSKEAQKCNFLGLLRIMMFELAFVFNALLKGFHYLLAHSHV